MLILFTNSKRSYNKVDYNTIVIAPVCCNAILDRFMELLNLNNNGQEGKYL